MRVLVTGGAGFIGSAIVRTLLANTDYTVINVDTLTYAGTLASLSAVLGDHRHVFERVDIRDKAEMWRVFDQHRPDAVLHLAAESHVDRSIDAPTDFVGTNVLGTFNLLESVRRYLQKSSPVLRTRFRFIHVSTDEVFGSLGPEGRFTETTAYDPRSPYAATKAAADHLVRAWQHTYDLPAIVTNCSNNYGPYQFPEKLIPLAILSALEGRSVPVYGQGDNVRDWLFVDDHASALLTVLHSGAVGRTYGIGGNSERRNLDVVERICDVLDELVPSPVIGPRRSLIRFVADRPGHDRRYAMDCTRIATELGWRQTETFDSGLRRTVAWYVANREWCERIQKGTYRGERLGLGAAV